MQRRNKKSNQRIYDLLKSHCLTPLFLDHPVDDVVITLLIDHLPPTSRMRVGRSKYRIAVPVCTELYLKDPLVVFDPFLGIAEDLVRLGNCGKL